MRRLGYFSICIDEPKIIFLEKFRNFLLVADQNGCAAFQFNGLWTVRDLVEMVEA